MKNRGQELLRRMQRQYHQRNPWDLQNGLYITHSYKEVQPDALSWWDDVGFILNKRRIMIWWQHPRCIYYDTIDEQSLLKAGDGPQDNWFLEEGQKNYRKVGASRKKLIGYTCKKMSVEQRLYYDHLENIRQRISREGIDFDISPSWRRENLNWAVGVDLVVPMEVRNEQELALLVSLTRRLLLRQTTLETEFPDYRYGRSEWLKEQVRR
jgi:predicted DNA binding CopG/RHH family protein